MRHTRRGQLEHEHARADAGASARAELRKSLCDCVGELGLLLLGAEDDDGAAPEGWAELPSLMLALAASSTSVARRESGFELIAELAPALAQSDGAGGQAVVAQLAQVVHTGLADERVTARGAPAWLCAANLAPSA